MNNMNRLFLFCFVEVFVISFAVAAPPDLVQLQVVEYARRMKINLDRANDGIESSREETQRNGKALQQILEMLKKNGVSQCAVRDELHKERPQDLKQIRYTLNDLLEERLRWFELANARLSTQIASNHKLSLDNTRAIKSIARTLAANATSLTELREESIPRIQKELQRLFSRTSDVEVRIALVENFVGKMQPFCDKVNILWEERHKQLGLHEDYRAMSPPSLSDELSRDATPTPKPKTTVWRTVNGTDWEPRAYSSSFTLCPNPTLKFTNVTFDTNVKTGSGWIPRRYYGDIWIDCSGTVVLVEKFRR